MLAGTAIERSAHILKALNAAGRSENSLCFSHMSGNAEAMRGVVLPVTNVVDRSGHEKPDDVFISADSSGARAGQVEPDP